MRISKLGLALGVALPLLAGPVAAQDKPDGLDETARRAIEALVEAMRSVVAKIPMYEAPEILENGDIIIRRKRPEPEDNLPEGQTRT